MGRRKEFDRDEVLDRALALFLRQGYEATSVRDLVDATGVNRFSLYECFGDKHRLFLAALDRFHAQRRAVIEELFAEEGPKLPQLRRYFQAIIDDGLRLDRPGCLMLNSTIELARTDPEVAMRAARHFANLEELFVKALETAQRQGEVRLTSDLRSIARFLLNNARGLRVVVQYTQDRDVVEDILSTVWTIFESPEGLDEVGFQNERSEIRAGAAF
jgi:TetR/AcrR family transcriptional repressor of nem operon